MVGGGLCKGDYREGVTVATEARYYSFLWDGGECVKSHIHYSEEDKPVNVENIHRKVTQTVCSIYV